MRQDAKIERIAAIPLFAGASRKQLDHIASLCTEATAQPGEVLCREGESGSEFFVLLEGSVAVSRAGRELTTLTVGDFFGELALLDGKARNATVTAAGPVLLLVLSRAEFQSVMHDDPEVAVRMLPAIGARLRAGDGPAADRPAVV